MPEKNWHPFHHLQEQVRRASEERYRLHQVVREVEEDVKSSWNRRENQRELGSVLGQQAAVSDDLLTSYVEQFRVGRRSLLDVLDSQNTRYNYPRFSSRRRGLRRCSRSIGSWPRPERCSARWACRRRPVRTLTRVSDSA